MNLSYGIPKASAIILIICCNLKENFPKPRLTVGIVFGKSYSIVSSIGNDKTTLEKLTLAENPQISSGLHTLQELFEATKKYINRFDVSPPSVTLRDPFEIRFALIIGDFDRPTIEALFSCQQARKSIHYFWTAVDALQKADEQVHTNQLPYFQRAHYRARERALVACEYELKQIKLLLNTHSSEYNSHQS